MKAIGFNIGITLEYSDLFDEKTTVEGLLTGIDRKFLMDCASLFLSPKASRDFRNPKEYFHQLFCKENQKFVSECDDFTARSNSLFAFMYMCAKVLSMPTRVLQD